MKKLNKFLLGGLVCAMSFTFMNSVKADGPLSPLLSNPNNEYQVYENGSNIMYDANNISICNSPYHGCESYTVSEDDGVKDSFVKLTNSNREIQVNKADLASGYVVSATKNIEIYFSGEGTESEILESDFDKVTKMTFFKSSDDMINIIKNASKYDNVYLKRYDYYQFANRKMIIPKDVTVTVDMLDANEISNEGILKVGYLGANKVYGNGIINVNYKAFVGDGPINNTPVANALRFDVKNISGVKVDISNFDVEEGTSFGIVGLSEDYTKEEAQKVIDMYNTVLGTSMKNYHLELAKYNVEGDEEYYYGTLVKGIVKQDIKTEDTSKQDTKTNTKNDEVKNPSTGDATDLTAIIIMVSGVLAAITFKKVKQR